MQRTPKPGKTAKEPVLPGKALAADIRTRSGATVWAAAYQPSAIPHYRGNPLIETLPPLMSRAEIANRLRGSPAYNEADRKRPPNERLPLMLHAMQFFQPLTCHLELAEMVSGMIREGYVARNPQQFGYWQTFPAKLRSALAYQPDAEEDVEQRPISGLTLIGMSGIGKSRTMTRILRLMPQVIEHAMYNSQRFTHRQLTYVKLDCPPDGSRAGLCKQFFHEVDRQLRTSYYERYAVSHRPPVDSMLISMGNVCILNSIGVLVIDEVQNLREAHHTDVNRILNFFTTLDNAIGVPVVLIGTPRARKILTGGFRRARRAEGQGGLTWDRLLFDHTWRLFLETLWRYQYTDEYCALDDELSELIYDESQGIADIAIKLFVLTQLRAIARKQRRITPAAIRKTAQEHLRFVRDFLAALRTGNSHLLEQDARFDDLELPQLDDAVDGMKHALSARPPELRIAVQPGSAQEATPSDSPEGRDWETSDTGNAETAARDARPVPAPGPSQPVQPPQQAEHVCRGGSRRTRGTTASAAPMPRSGRRGHSATEPYQHGLLSALLESRRSGTTPYDALKSAGYIRSAEEYLSEETE